MLAARVCVVLIGSKLICSSQCSHQLDHCLVVIRERKGKEVDLDSIFGIPNTKRIAWIFT